MCVRLAQSRAATQWTPRDGGATAPAAPQDRAIRPCDRAHSPRSGARCRLPCHVRISRMLARLFRQLAPFQPTLIGTFPLGLQVDGSDLDIACTCDDLEAFERAL